MNKLSLLITGSSGFIGTHLLEELLPKNKIIGISHTLDKKKLNYTPLRKNIIKPSSLNFSKKISGIIHLAAITDIKYCEKNPQQCFETNVLGTLNILELARKNDCRVVYVSTSHVYGTPQKLPISENHSRKPKSSYAASKLAGEFLCESYSQTYKMNISIVRLFSVYGPNSPPYLVTSRIIDQLGKRSINLGNLDSKRDFIFIKDAINGIQIVFRKNRGFNAYNIGTGTSYSIKYICKALKKISDYNTKIKSIPSLIRKDEVKNVIADTTKIKKLGWKNKTNILKGLELTLIAKN